MGEGKIVGSGFQSKEAVVTIQQSDCDELSTTVFFSVIYLVVWILDFLAFES